MRDVFKPIHLSNHARMQLFYRGTSEEEIFEAIRTSQWKPAELDRWECRKEFTFDQIWNGKLYKIKQVRPIFAEEEKEITVVTVYVYYF